MFSGSYEQLFDAEPDTPEGDELEVLIALVDYYEEKTFPIAHPEPKSHQ